MTRILITGASGFLGHNLAGSLCARHEIFAAFHLNRLEAQGCTPVALDIEKASDVQTLMERIRPALVIHSAAISQPDECERDPEHARGVILSGTANVAEACRRSGARLVHISTDLVFDGKRGWYTEDDEVRGISVYSHAKIDAERAVEAIAPSSMILRVALLFGIGSSSHPGSIAAMIRSWRDGKVMTFYTDQYRTPAFAPQVAEVVEKALDHPEARGIFHFGGADRISRYEFAAGLAERVGASLSLLRPGSMADSKATAPRGADCSLVSNKIQRLLDVRPLSCFEALDMMARDGILPRL